MKHPLVLSVVALCVVCAAPAFETGGANDITAVSGRTSKDYVRARLTNGSFAPELYAFGKGGNWAGSKADASIDKLTFLDVAHVIAAPLASQNYLPSSDPQTAKLLIMVYWGTTHAPEHASDSNGYQNLQAANDSVNRAEMRWKAERSGEQAATSFRLLQQAQDEQTTAIAAASAENKVREQNDKLNVMMLGYDSWWDQTQKFTGTPLDYRRQDLFDEIEEDRYFVVLMAYDFQLLSKQKKHKLLWETRFSIRQRHHDFDKDLPAMAKYASQYFGQDSGGLVHKPIPLGRVEIGDVKSLGEVPAK